MMPTIEIPIQKPPTIAAFQKIILEYYSKHARKLPWRKKNKPYHILISEIMLQQTQVERVKDKFVQFVERFPTIADVANATLFEVLELWLGLGYNRRARNLRDCAQIIMSTYKGKIPQDPEILVKLPGIGKATAASIAAFAYNKPTVFIETNIRAVFIHFFFAGKTNVSDEELLPYIQKALPTDNAYVWYSALMDYGVFLKKNITNPSRKSKHHSTQSAFVGSDRQIRGAILKHLIRTKKASLAQLQSFFPKEPERVEALLKNLKKEKLIIKTNTIYSIA